MQNGIKNTIKQNNKGEENMINYNRIIKYIKHPSKFFIKLDEKGIFRLPDKLFIKLQFYNKMGYKLDLKNPKTFNEKLQWLKLYDRNPIYTTMVDKYEAKKYVGDIIGDEYIIPTIGIYNSFDEINFDELPKKFVMKCTHDSGGIVICKDKANFDIEAAREKINKSLKTNYYWVWREWQYKNVKPRIIIEKYMEDKETKELRDYKFFCFNGEVKVFKIDFDRFINHKANYFDKNKKLLRFGENICPPDFNRKLEMPYNIDKMIELAEQLSKDKPFIRIDFYEMNKKIYFGELTFCPAAGIGSFEPEEWDYKLGQFIKLPEKNKKKK